MKNEILMNKNGTSSYSWFLMFLSYKKLCYHLFQFISIKYKYLNFLFDKYQYRYNRKQYGDDHSHPWSNVDPYSHVIRVCLGVW